MKHKEFDKQLDLEFAYHTYADSCKNVFDFDTLCRRSRYEEHTLHAAGYGEQRRYWVQAPDGFPVAVEF